MTLALGRNPYEMIGSDGTNPGHVRGFAWLELQKLASLTRFAVVTVDRRYYFDARFAHHQGNGAAEPSPRCGAMKNAVYSGRFLCGGLTLVIRKESFKELS